MIPLWRRYQRSFIFGVLCMGLIMLMLGNVGFWQSKKNGKIPDVQGTTDVILPQQNEPLSEKPKTSTYVVSSGDTLESIARKFSIDIDTLRSANPQIQGDTINLGDQLVILPERGVLHVVKSGQTLWGIGRQYDIDVERIRQKNPDITESLRPGEKIFVPGATMRSNSDVSRGMVEPQFAWPAHGVITSPYGNRWGRLHSGIDIAGDLGEPIYATRNGRVVFSGWKGGYGLAVIIDHGRGWETLYGHANEIYVAAGDTVQSGTTIAAIGNTGNSTGPHLHFEVRYQGVPANPMQYLQ